MLAVASDPTGPSAEAFRMLRGNLEFVAVDVELKSILFTSARQGEGKTTTAGNLALMLARAGKRVIVVDCDLRRPRLHTYFGLQNKTGLSTLLTGHGTVADTLRSVAVPTAGEVDAGVDKVEGREWIYVLTAGPVPPNPGEIVASQRLRDLLATLAADCDLLLIDCLRSSRWAMPRRWHAR
jgi:capsular exopolysaccharide synthesis family protein